jgi:hypothetical protein
MGTANTRRLTLIAAGALLLAALAAPGWCIETQLAGVTLGDTPEDLMTSPSFGPPDVMLTSGNQINFIKVRGTGLPLWVPAVRMDGLRGDQLQWVYNSDPVVIGVVITGRGINARVTDIVVSQWRNFKASKAAETEKGIRLGDTFADVLETYGWPNRMQVISEAGMAAAPAGAPAAPGAPAMAAAPMGLMLPGAMETAEEGPPMMAPAGPGPLPPVGVPTPGTPAGPANTATASGMTFSKACVLSYPSVDFLLYRMQVFRIHIYGRQAGM